MQGYHKIFFIKPTISNNSGPGKVYKSPVIASVTVMDPVLKSPTEVEIYRDPVSGGMFGIEAQFVEQKSDKIASPFNPEVQLKLCEGSKNKPFKTAYVFGSSDAGKAAGHQWKAMQNDPGEYQYATLEELAAFEEGIEEAIGWLECQGLDDKELKACKKARRKA